MKRPLLLLSLPAFFTALLALQLTDRYQVEQQVNRQTFLQQNLLRCSPGWEALKQTLNDTDIPPIPGAGTYKWTISTTNDSAQFYFNQGINMYYGFHIIEAMASFKKAAKFDPAAAMIQWAMALAYGPNINDLGYAASPDALAAINKAVELSSNCTALERGFIQAQAARYSADSAQTRSHLNQQYADQMQKLYATFPASADVAALYADAMMLQHPWDLWFSNGKPKAWTPRIRSVLEKLLTTAPLHPGANHYYIHVMEPSPYAALATASADRLGSLTPALSHMVHMPSHIYLRTGNYRKGITVNEEAVKSYQNVVQLFAPAAGADFLYVIHNLHMQTNHAIMIGNSKAAIASAKQTAASIPPDYLLMEDALGSYIQYIYYSSILVDIRYARWDALLAINPPPAKQVYSNVLYRFGRGMAYAHQKKLQEAQIEYDYLKALLNEPVLSLPFAPFSPAIDGANVAADLLGGTIALMQDNHAVAIERFSKAVTTEEQMVYNEPRDWLLNPKHYLGNAYLKMKEWKKAEEILFSDLQNNNNNLWAMTGLLTAYQQQGISKQVTLLQQELQKIRMQADVQIAAPVL